MENKEVIAFLLEKAYKRDKDPAEIRKALRVFFTKEEFAEGGFYALKKALKEVFNEL